MTPPANAVLASSREDLSPEGLSPDVLSAEDVSLADVLAEIAQLASQTIELQDVFDRVADSLRRLVTFDDMKVVRIVEADKVVVHATTYRAARLEATVESLTRELEGRGRGRVIGDSPGWREVLRQVGRVAASETTVLITGESGTGKEIVSRLIHEGSPRASEPFVAVNCAALPEQLLESELFGHEKGAFTGAISTKIGRLEQAAGGTLLPWPPAVTLWRSFSFKTDGIGGE